MAYIEHYGTPRHSGRYPWGSGENPYQSEKGMLSYINARRKEGATDKEIANEFLKDNQAFLSYVHAMRSQGVPDTEIAKQFDRSTTWLRQKQTIAVEADKAAKVALAIKLKEHGYSNAAIAEKIGVANESTVRSLLARSEKRKETAVENTANGLKEVMKDHPFIDVGRGNEALIGVTQTRLGTAVNLLKDEGYQVFNINVEQLGTGYKTKMPVLCPPGSTIKDAYDAYKANEIATASGFKVVDNGQKIKFMNDPVSIDSKRVAIRYAEDGGTDMDGVIQIRRGVEDLTLGASRYAQARILVDGDKYLKGMAVYADDLPDGVDIRFNTNKSKDTPFGDVLKKVKRGEDGKIIEENMFGAIITDQPTYVGKDGKEHQGAVNIVNQEGDWADWKKTISSQMLSKQPIAVVKEQLSKTYASQAEEYDEIMSLTNPTVKRVLLEDYSSKLDSAAVHLKAQGFDRQSSEVILPVNSLKENEIYAPRYNDGERVVLIRHPHAGQFEIPELVVNNKNKEAESMMGKNPKDAVGINHHTAQILSGADFDGDTVLVIPNNEGKIKRRGPLRDLENFDPSSSYPAYEGMTKVGPKKESASDGIARDGFNKGREMGDISNLITDMTIKGADAESEIARAVKYSMVVIDAEKHNLNWKQAYQDCGIAELKEKYQGSKRAGASTLISRAKGQAHIDQLSLRTSIDPETGELVRYETGDTYKKQNKKGEWVEVKKTTKSNKMTEAFASGKDAYSLLSDNPSDVEIAYADYANKVKAQANKARKDAIAQPPIKVSPSARKTYAKEVASLNEKVLESKKNAAYEKQALVLANNIVSSVKKDKPDMTYEEVQKVKSQALKVARTRVKGDSHKSRIDVTPSEWEAIQAGAISNNMLNIILKKADMDQIRQYATPRKDNFRLSSGQLASIKTKMNSGNYTSAEIASEYGISVSTLYKIVES